jgi:uronate dehydrogenase
MLDPGYAALYSISANGRRVDLGPGRTLRYHPQDDSQQYAAAVEQSSETEADRAEAAHVGGPYATAEVERPAFD